MASRPTESQPALPESVSDYPLFQALLHRRSRRFAAGMTLDGGPLSYASRRKPEPLRIEEEAALAFAAAGLTGPALAELPYESGSLPESGGGNIMTHFVGRTAASGDAMHDNAVFVINDEGAWMLRRPQELERSALPELIALARSGRLVELFERLRVRVANGRVDVERALPFVPPFNKWSANVPGTTYFLPVAECTALYINIMLSVFSEDFAYLVVDDRAGFQPAGVGQFAQSAGGHLHDDPMTGRVGTVTAMETWLYEFVAIESGAILQNLGLMGQALGLGGFPHFAAHPFGWTSALGFRMESMPLSGLAGGTGSDREPQLPFAVGLEADGRPLLKPYSPPYYASMEEAVLAFVDYKFAEGKGTFRDGGAASGWKDAEYVQRGIPRYSDEAIAATIGYCQYVFDRYGRFPAHSGPFRTVLAYQAHRLDADFYDRFYRPEALTATQRQREATEGR